MEETTVEEAQGQPDSPEGEQRDPKVADARRYRQRAQQAEAERDQLADQLAALQQQALTTELATSGRGVKLDALIAAGYSVADFFDGTGIDRGKLREAVQDVGARFGIDNRVGVVPTQGTGSYAPRAEETTGRTWSDAFRRVNPTGGGNPDVLED